MDSTFKNKMFMKLKHGLFRTNIDFCARGHRIMNQAEDLGLHRHLCHFI